MAARVIKSGSVDDDQFPLPADPRANAAGHPANQMPGGMADGVEPAELQHALGELQQMVGMITGMRPAVQELSEHLRTMGAQQGYSDGVARAQAEVEQQLIDVIAALTAAQQERHRLALEHEAAIADLALRVARKVIGSNLDANPQLVSQIVMDTVRELEPSSALEVRVHPEDAPIVEQGRAELERMVQGGGAVTITPDPTVERGGVILVSPVGEVDARVSTKLHVLETAFAAQRRRLTTDA